MAAELREDLPESNGVIVVSDGRLTIGEVTLSGIICFPGPTTSYLEVRFRTALLTRSINQQAGIHYGTQKRIYLRGVCHWRFVQGGVDGYSGMRTASGMRALVHSPRFTGLCHSARRCVLQITGMDARSSSASMTAGHSFAAGLST